MGPRGEHLSEGSSRHAWSACTCLRGLHAHACVACMCGECVLSGLRAVRAHARTVCVVCVWSLRERVCGLWVVFACVVCACMLCTVCVWSAWRVPVHGVVSVGRGLCDVRVACPWCGLCTCGQRPPSLSVSEPGRVRRSLAT